MSRECSTAPNDDASAKAYLRWLIWLNVFDEIYLCGSRSPLRNKQPHKFSDWDFVAITKLEKLSINMPRETGQLHADVCILTEAEKNRMDKKTVMLYPTNEHGILV